MLLALAMAAPQALRVLFVGNSLLNFNDVPLTVTKMLQTDGRGGHVVYRSYFVGHLEDVRPGSEVDREVGSGYDVVVLQAAKVSSSMTRTYSQVRGIAMAKSAIRHGSRVLLYVEWPRRGIDEAEYTMNVYRGIARASGAEVLPVCYAWMELARKRPGVELWAEDGNHATAAGSYLAACCVYYRIAGRGRAPAYRPPQIDDLFAEKALAASRKVEERWTIDKAKA